MFEPLEDIEEPIKIGISAPQKSTLLDVDYFIPFSELSDEVLSTLKLDLLFVVGASPLQTALVKHWSQDLGCIAACVETIDKQASCAESVIANIKQKFETGEFPNNVDVADIRYLADDDNQLLAFNNKEKLAQFLSDESCPYVDSVFYLMHGDFTAERFGEEHKQVAQYISENATIFYSYLAGGLGDCTALVAVRR
ncbi:hypothetical protein BIY22_11695 [Vibrio panuliri]|uniref:Uncharacterized protein n=1 Tax=Vibrio panuliri TaxID=1381081 RepID=A0A1Q9HAV9_9VIBR|nr:hypothetical protein [Vibrio panuliri]OLQ86305.1 hypothetical protein BIY22_11695 [Vibrio panuliri]